jgi:DeoR/GlpR family transcriptional regulator of sugar metabolism
MLAQQRQTAILDLVRRDGGVRVSQLVRQFGVSDMTIRRDLEALAERGLVDKVHGGATVTGPGSTEEPGYDAKSVRQQSEKAAIAARAATLVEPGTAVALSAGTTTAALAARLIDVPGLTVVTNSIPVADALYHSRRTDQAVVLTGGIRTPSNALAGPVAEAAISTLNVDVLFLGVHGISPRAGFTTPNLMEAGTNRLLVAAARRLVVLADHTKWEIIGIATIAPLESADILITDSGLPPQARDQLSQRVGELVVVDTTPVRPDGASAPGPRSSS